MKVLVTGASGFVGKRLCTFLLERNHNVIAAVRKNIHFVDLVVPEIPYIACKRNSNGKNIIDRIPLDESGGSLVYYSSDINLDNFFYPINICNICSDSVDFHYLIIFLNSLMVLDKPTNIDSPTKKWPILNSFIPFVLASIFADL